MLRLRLLQLAMVAICFAWACTSAVAQEPGPKSTTTPSTKITFQAATDTNLSELLRARRQLLEQRQGEPLSPHQWWLWGLGSFDYDRDGDVDLIVCIHGSTGGVILRNQLQETGQLSFVDATAQLGVEGSIPSTDNYPLIWDFEGDGDLDIAGLLDDTRTPCLLNQGGKRFEPAAYSLHPLNAADRVADLNDDRYLDVTQVRGDKQVQYLYDPDRQAFTKRELPHDPLAELPQSLREQVQAIQARPENRFLKLKVLPCDLNGDQHPDRVVQAFGSYAGDRLGWYLLAQADGSLVERTEQMGLPREGTPLLIADLDHDGDSDLLIASADEAGMYLNNGTGNFTKTPGDVTEFIKQRCPYLHAAWRVDFDHDGDLDLTFSNRRYGKQLVLENLGQGNFATVLEVKGWDADPVALCDMNNDGLLDVVVGGAEKKESIGIYLNVTPQVGNGCRLYVRGESPNRYAVGTRVELYRAGSLGTAGAVARMAVEAPLDGSPIHLGLGEASEFDLRVSFPGQESFQLKNIAAESKLYVTPRGISSVPPKH